jgi:hypothetical protein
MFWETPWALVLGFGLSGAVQAFISRAEMQRALGGHGPGDIGRATCVGMVSSSCSYAACKEPFLHRHSALEAAHGHLLPGTSRGEGRPNRNGLSRSRRAIGGSWNWAGQRPFQTGARFSRKAATPSFLSSVSISRAKHSIS